MLSIIDSNCVVACSCDILRFSNEVVGGMYMFIIFIRWLFGSIILVCKAYSLPLDDSIYSGFLTYVAIHPRVLSGRRCSIIVKPSSIGGAAPSASHVSYKHMTSRSCYSNRRRSLR